MWPLIICWLLCYVIPLRHPQLTYWVIYWGQLTCKPTCLGDLGGNSSGQRENVQTPPKVSIEFCSLVLWGSSVNQLWQEFGCFMFLDLYRLHSSVLILSISVVYIRFKTIQHMVHTWQRTEFSEWAAGKERALGWGESYLMHEFCEALAKDSLDFKCIVQRTWPLPCTGRIAILENVRDNWT